MASTLNVAPGARYGRLTVVDVNLRMPPTRRQAERGHSGFRAFRVRCECGSEKTVQAASVVDGRVVSCGCQLRESASARASARNFIDGRKTHPLYVTWVMMIQRCENPNAEGYSRWGGRGIRVCAEWHDPAVFLAWVDANLGPRPDGYSLDRIDNDGDYEPGNVRWADVAAQNANRRTSAAHRIPQPAGYSGP